MNIKQALKRGITEVKHPNWKRGHLHIAEVDGRIELHGQANEGGITWRERLAEYADGNDYEEFKHAGAGE